MNDQRYSYTPKGDGASLMREIAADVGAEYTGGDVRLSAVAGEGLKLDFKAAFRWTTPPSADDIERLEKLLREALEGNR